MGYKVSAEEEPNGINRTIEENFLDKLETIIENTVFGSSGLSIDPITLSTYLSTYLTLSQYDLSRT